MYAIRQLLRQPLKMLSGILMIALAVAALYICVGQAATAKKTAEHIDYSFTTVALYTDKCQYVEGPYQEQYLAKIPDEFVEWIDRVAEENQELVETVSSPGLASAYINNLNPENYTDHLDANYLISQISSQSGSKVPSPIGSPYSCAMLEIKLEHIGKPNMVFINVEEDGTISDTVSCYVEVLLSGTISQVIGLQEGYRDPTGTTIYLTLELPDWESLEELELIVGEQYLVYGMDYQDLDWQLRSKIAWRSDCEIDEFDLEQIQFTDEGIVARAEEEGKNSYTAALYKHEDTWIHINNDDILMLQSSGLTLVDGSAVPVKGNIVTKSDGSSHFEPIGEYAYVDENGQLVTVSLEEYRERYGVPTITHLEGSAEEFLVSDQGAAWREVLEQLEINNHAFPIIGVDKLGYIAEFARGNSRIVEGRDFTKEELDTGATVCVISETLAAANGLAVGDTISLRYYRGDGSLPYQYNIESGYGTTNPTAYFYFATTPFEGEAVEYTIVGLYRQDNAWCDVSENLYSFTPNTIFTPKASVTGTMTYSNQGFFRTIVLKNGALERFMEIVDSAGYEGLFVYYDQGYSVVAANLHNYQTVSQKAMVVGIAVYAIVFLLFMLMFPLRCGHTIMIMESLGTDRGNIVWYVLKSSLGIVIPGTMVGVTVGMVLWKRVVDAIMTSAGAVLDLVMDPMVLCTIVVVQLCLVICMVLIAAMVMTRPKCLMSGE